MRRAVELNPNNSVAHLWFTHNLCTHKRFAEGAEQMRRAVELDPTSFQNRNTAAWGFYFERRFDLALAKADYLIERFPAAAHSYFAKSSFLRILGRHEESLKVMRRALELSDDTLFVFFGHAAAGKKREALKIIENPPRVYSSDYHTAIIYCYLKDKNKAFTALDQSVRKREATLIWLGIEPAFDYLRDDPRYQVCCGK